MATTDLKLEVIEIDNSDGLNFILGQSHFIKTVEDLHEALVSTVPGIKFGLAFSEASGERLIRYSGTDEDLTTLARTNLKNIGAGHSFIIFLKDAFPINVLKTIKDVYEVVNIYCATANKTEVIVGATSKGRAILGVVDGESPVGFENENDISKRKEFLRKIGYKF